RVASDASRRCAHHRRRLAIRHGRWSALVVIQGAGMFFRNLLMYRLSPDYRLDVEALPKALAEKPARPCGSQELSTYGFVAPLGKGEDASLLHACQGFLLIAARKEERMLPSSVVRDALQEKIEAIE